MNLTLTFIHAYPCGHIGSHSDAIHVCQEPANSTGMLSNVLRNFMKSTYFRNSELQAHDC